MAPAAYHPAVATAPPEPARPGTRRLSLGRRLAFTGVTLVLALLLLEGALQLLAALQPPQTLATDDLPPADPSAFRVVAVGDSWVYGAESEPHEAFIEVFRRDAASRLDRPVQVYNLGVSASNSSQALVALHGALDIAQPDLVVALTGANDGLHQRGVAEAAAILGQDVRTVPGLSRLAGLRTVRLGRLIWVNLVAPVAAPAPEAAVATPSDPQPRASTIVQLPWWDLVTSRRWTDALTLVQQLAPPDDSDAARGLKRAWEALLLAHTGDLSAAKVAALDALALGGDDVVAHEALAVAASVEQRTLDALQHRARAALASGHPALRDRARGLVLMDLERWEAARAWLLSYARAVPGDLETLVALAGLPPTVRTEEVEALLFEGPRGLVTPPEYLRWHLASSGQVDRAVASLGDPDPDEPFPLQAARAQALALTGQTEDAGAAWLALLDSLSDDAPSHHRDIAAGGATRHGALPATTTPSGPAEALGATVAHQANGDCPAALLSAQRAMELGVLPIAVEELAEGCLSRAKTWSLSEMVVEREHTFDRDALVSDEVRTLPLPAPSVPFWDDLIGRRLGPAAPADPLRPPVHRVRHDLDDLPTEWRALAHSLAGRADEPVFEEVAEGLEVGAEITDPAVGALALGLRLLHRGDEKHAIVRFAHAAESVGTPWARTLARGLGASLARDWSEAQTHLCAAESVSLRMLEILRALRRVPDDLATGRTRELLERAPAGRVTAEQWALWFLEPGHEDWATLALRWSWAHDPERPVRDRLAALARDLERRRTRTRDEPDPDGDLSELARRWLAGHQGAGSGERAEAAPPADPADPLVTTLEAMGRLAASQDAAFVALTYPFPSGHHAQVRERILTADVAVLDQYAAFEAAYSPRDWEALRTPQDHVNAEGYALMGRQLVEWATREGLLPRPP